MPDKIRWGLLSTANINKALINPIHQAERSELVAVASRDAGKAKAYAAEWNIPKAYGSYEALLAAPDIDVIYISLPNALHCEWTVKAAQAGKHVLCEKPITITLEELDQVERAASANRVTIFEAFMYLHHPQTRRAKALIQAGKIGQVQQINSWFHFYLPPERAENIRLSAALSGGSLWDVGVYPNSMAITMAGAGAPVEVYADQIIGETGVDVAMRAQLKFGNGVAAQISSGFRTPFREAAYLVGDAGMITINQPWKPGLEGKQDSQIVLTSRSGAEETIVFPAIDPYLCEVQVMEACLLDGAEPVLPLSQSKAFLKCALAMVQSAVMGQVIYP